ncbi:TPA: DUF3850 domain-containing protein [Enterobacter asburiae]|nr:DUF3850 domain-containing protein [Enterobacter asburiae]
MSTITREPVTHNLKIWPKYFSAVRDGLKRAELRWNDREYQTGDILDLCEWDPNEESFTGDFISVTVTHVAELGQWMPGYVLLSIAPPAPENAEPVAWLWSHRKHQNEVTLVRPEDDERAEGAHWSGWSCQALYAAQPAPVSVPDNIDARMKNAGMLSATEIIAGQPIDAFMKHAGVVDLASLLKWAEMRRAEFLRMQAKYVLGDNPKDDMYEWVISHVAAFSELHVNIRAAMLQGADGNSQVIPDGSEDTKRLDWLDAQNKRLNEYYGTTYGWKFDANFQRNAMMLNDSNYPVMTVRQAIDEAIAAAPKQEVK